MDSELAEEKGENEEFASAVEKFISLYYAPELLTKQGRYSILTLWVVFTFVMLYGAAHVEVNFNFEFFIPPGSATEEYFVADLEHFGTGFFVDIVIDNRSQELDYASAETQY